MDVDFDRIEKPSCLKVEKSPKKGNSSNTIKEMKLYIFLLTNTGDLPLRTWSFINIITLPY
jgi:hypothetical protein